MEKRAETLKARLPKGHFLKTWPEYFKAVQSGIKTFELRLNDRDFRLGDTLLLGEYLPQEKKFTGQQIQKRISYVLHGGVFGLEEGFVILGLEAV